MAAQPVMNLYDNLPSELKALPHWCVWIYKVTPYGKTKVPFNALTNRPADSTDPSTWVSFELACANVGRYEGLGFFFSKSIKKVGIDLDYTDDPKLIESHIKIFNTTSSYAERSPSGKGLHIICEGEVPRGVKSASKKVEMYDQWRFFTMTGDVVRAAPIVNEQFIIDALFNDIGKLKDVEGFDPKDGPEIEDDQTIYNRASNASNGELFATLWAGKWQDDYQSQSEADQALINILAFYSNNFAQVARMFRKSGLGQRDKAKRDNYVMPTVKRAFDQKTPTVESIMNMSADFNALLEAQKERASGNAGALQPEAQTTPVGKGDKPTGSDGSSHIGALQSTPSHLLKPPPGLLGEVAQYIYQSAPLPVPQIALAGAIGFLAGMCGRAFNVSGTGLNQYVLLLAETGRGKEGMKAGIRRIVSSMEMSMPTVRDMIGPGRINSGQSLGPYLEDHPTKCFVSIQSEFDSSYSQMIARNANGAMQTLKSQYLDLYMASGKDASTDPSIYSDRKKGIAAIRSPSFTLLAECTLTHMNKILNEDQISDGLLTRFLNIVYDGEQVPFNEFSGQPPNRDFIERLCYLYNTCLTTMAKQQVINVDLSPESEEMFKGFREYARIQVNDKEKARYAALWNRAYLKSVKLAALIAASNCAHSGAVPVIDIEAANWAVSVVKHDILNVVGRFEKHEIGEQNNDLAQLRDVKSILSKFYKLNKSQVRAYRMTEKMHTDEIVSFFYIHSVTTGFKSLKEDRNGHSKALEKTIKTLCDLGILFDMSVDKKYAKDTYGTTQKMYKILVKSEVGG